MRATAPMLRLLAAAAASLLLLTLAPWAGGGGGKAVAQGRAAPVAVDAVIREPLSRTASVIGRMVARQQGTVAALTRGPVREVLVDVGARVREGDVLLRLDDRRLVQARNVAAALLTAARAARESADSALELARQESQRLGRLKGSAAFSQARFDDKMRDVAIRESSAREAEARIARARADVQLADIDLDLAAVKAPFNGVILDRHTVRGAYVSIGDGVFTLINDEDLEIEAEVPVSTMAALTPGVEVTVDYGVETGGPRGPARVRALLPVESALTRTRKVRFTPMDDGTNAANGDEAAMAAGRTVRLLIPVGVPEPVLTVHKDAVLAQGDGNIVYIVDGDTVSPRPINLGLATGSRVVVSDGLAEGDLVVVRGNERLRPGQKVRYPGLEAPADSTTAGG